MKTYYNSDYAELHAIDNTNWEAFKIKNYRDVSDFESWAMRLSFNKLFGEYGESRRIWTDGTLEFDNYEQRETLTLCLTENEQLILKVFDKDNDMEQTEQYLVEMIINF